MLTFLIDIKRSFGKENRMLKIINFYPQNKIIEDFFTPPVPSSSKLPKWWTDASIYVNKNRKTKLNQMRDFKSCAAFGDTLSIGYMLVTPCDIEISFDNGNIIFQTIERFPFKLAGLRGTPIENQTQGYNMPIPDDCFSVMYHWEAMYGFKVPKGYSLLITSPLNRHDLPFVCTSGIIDSDAFFDAGLIPFFIRRNAIGSIIPAGTPFAQLIPIKRDTWKSITHKFNEKFNNKIQKMYFIDRYYKKYLWKQKKYY